MTEAHAASPVLADLHRKHKERQERLKAAAIKEITVQPITVTPPPQEPVPEPVRGNSIPPSWNSFDIVMHELCAYFKVRKEDILSERRLNYIADRRHLLAYMMYWLTDYTNPRIGARLGRDPTSIGYAIKRIQSNLPLYRKDIEELEARIKPLLPQKRKP